MAVIDPGRANGVGVVAKLLAALSVRIVADDQIAGEQKNLFPVLMDEWCGRERAGLDAQQARAIAAPVVFIECAGDDFLFEAWRIAGPGSASRSACPVCEIPCDPCRTSFVISPARAALIWRVDTSRHRRRGGQSEQPPLC
jgi:hypothetical protein